MCIYGHCQDTQYDVLNGMEILNKKVMLSKQTVRVNATQYLPNIKTVMNC